MKKILLYSILLLLQGCATMEKLAQQEHAQVYCIANATVIPFVGTVAKAHCTLFWGAPWSW